MEAGQVGPARVVLRPVVDVEAALDDLPEAGVDQAPRPRGRPKLGVVAREITLLPRHWEWLATQPGGASVALRKLVDAARHTYADSDRATAGWNRFLWLNQIAGFGATVRINSAPSVPYTPRISPRDAQLCC